MTDVWIEICRGRDGSTSVYIADESGSGHRIAGGKPWGGGTTIHRWKVDAAEVIEAVQRIATSSQETASE